MIKNQNTSTVVIDLQNVSKQYTIRNWRTFLFRRPRIIPAIKDISLQVKEGEIMGLLGPNGAGKTTLLKILATLITPDTGKAVISSLDCAAESLEVRKHVGYVNTNDRSFYWRLSGYDNLKFFGHLHNLYGLSLTKRVKEVIKLTSLENKQHQSFGTYSSGERQRLAIARAMLSNPKILLMDEATANLDPIVSKELIQFTKLSLAKEQKKTIIWCTHNLVEAEELCDKVAILFKGKIISCSKTSDLNQQLSQKEVYRLIVDTIPQELEQQENFTLHNHSTHKCCTVTILKQDIPKLLRILTKQNIDIYECMKIEQSFEDRFFNLLRNSTQ